MSEKVRCIIVDDEPMARDILRTHVAQISSLTVVADCKSAVEAFQVIAKERIDLIFLDINMPEISGLSFAKSVNKEIKIIFTTAYREYAVDGFDLQAVDYLLKPISYNRLLQAVNKYLNENHREEPILPKEIEQEKNDSLFVRSERKMVKVDFAEILFIESVGDYIKIHCSEHNILTRETISNMESKLPRNEFIRTHRSFLVATRSIASYTGEYIEIGENVIPISRTYKEQVMQLLEK